MMDIGAGLLVFLVIFLFLGPERMNEFARQCGRLIREMRDSQELHILLCSHLLRDVEETCEEVLILKDGHQVHHSNLEEERKANRRFVELETLGNDDSFAEAVEGLGCECAVTSTCKMKMVVPESFAIRDLYRLAEERRVQIRRLNFRRDSLEEIFLKSMESTNGRS